MTGKNRIIISPASFNFPHEGTAWIEVDEKEFNENLLPFFEATIDEPLMVFKMEFGEFIMVQLGGVTAILATFPQATALRGG